MPESGFTILKKTWVREEKKNEEMVSYEDAGSVACFLLLRHALTAEQLTTLPVEASGDRD